ncbi:hypothetical protein Nmel_018186, partial [Mimus melanotis]
SCTPSPSQGGGLPSLALPKPSPAGVCPAWDSLTLSRGILPSLEH